VGGAACPAKGRQGQPPSSAPLDSTHSALQGALSGEAEGGSKDSPMDADTVGRVQTWMQSQTQAQCSCTPCTPCMLLMLDMLLALYQRLGIGLRLGLGFRVRVRYRV